MSWPTGFALQFFTRETVTMVFLTSRSTASLSSFNRLILASTFALEGLGGPPTLCIMRNPTVFCPLGVLKYRIIVEIYIRCTVPLQVLRESNGSIMVLQWASTEFALANYRVNDLIVAYLCPGKSTARRLQVANLNAETMLTRS
ncbi:hypothetical protein B0H13DRAFT_2341873 [Mycena leptocephala]|nr:hypothetical protein B0H13DRAFT_2341873 [Mycena leptocephala]